MFPTTRARSFDVLLATLLVACIAIKIETATSIGNVPSIVSKLRIVTRDVRRISSNIDPSALVKDEKEDSKFQARMMSSEMQEARSNQQDSSLTASDSWNPHSLIPTFTDQEQGDEMVALASDTEPEPVKILPANKSIAAQQSNQKTVSRDYERSKSEKSRDSREYSRVGSKHRPQLDEYYGDEEEEDEEPNKPMRGDYDHSSPEERERQNKFRTQDHTLNQYGDYSGPTSYDEGYGDGRLNKTAKVQTPVSENGWLPSVASANKAEIQVSRNQSGYRTSNGRALSDKLAGFLGRDSASPFSRADVAIEYLKNILKNRQNMSSDVSTGADSKQKEEQSKILLNKLSIGLKLDQKTDSSSTSRNSTEDKIEQPSIDFKQVDYRPQVDPTGMKNFLSQQADGKFSIVDAKPIPTSELAYHAQTHSIPSSTTKIPAESQSVPLQNPQFDPNQQGVSSHPQDILAANNAPIGTPLGGDYVESLDEFPRGLNQQQQNHNHHLYQQQHQIISAESQQSPTIYQQAKDDNRATPQQSDKSLHIHDQLRHQKQIALDHLQLPNNFYDQPPNYQLAAATSSKFFQLEQPNSDPMQTEHSKTQPIDSYKALGGSKEPTLVQQHKLNGLAGSQQDSINRTTQTDAYRRGKIEEARKVDLSIQKPLNKVSNDRSLAIQNAVQTAQQPQQQLPSAQQVPISSKLYKNEQPVSQSSQIQPYNQLPASRPPTQVPQSALPRVKPPRIVSYNYFESNPNEGGESELVATNYQLGDALYGSTGGVEQLLSNTELEAIQSQFMTAEHPIVPVSNDQASANRKHQVVDNDVNLAGLLASLKPDKFHPDALQRLQSQASQNEETLKELASNEAQVRVSTQGLSARPKPKSLEQRNPDKQHLLDYSSTSISDIRKVQDLDKKKSLVVYLNHPRQTDMTKVSDRFSQTQPVGESSVESFIAAKEFDSHGLSKDSKYLDFSNLRGSGDIKEGQDKDGLSVVVIGDAYKYKKIVLLISSRSGGLKFIPMVKDMKK